MKACLKKPCFWVLALIVLVVGSCAFWATYVWETDGNYWAWEFTSEQAYSNLANAQYPVPPLWSQDGESIVFNDGFRMHAATVDLPSVHSFRPENELSLEYASSLSPDGLIALIQYNKPFVQRISNRRFELATVDLDGSNHRILPLNNIYYPVWSPDGDHIAFLSFKNVPTSWIENSYRVGVGLHEKSLPFLHTVDRNGSDIRAYISDIVLANHALHSHPPVWSPDGNKIAFIGDHRTRSSPDSYAHPPRSFIAIADFTGSDIVKLVQTSSLPGWSPDSKRIAFVRHRDAVSTIYTIEADGANLHGVWSFPDTLPDLWSSHGDTRHPPGGSDRLPRGAVSWSKDGSEIRLHQSPFVVVNADGSNPRIMQGRPGSLASWSTDESQIAVYMPGHDIRLFTMDPDGSNKRSLARWDSAAGEFTAERAMITIQGFDWEPYPSSEEVEQ